MNELAKIGKKNTILISISIILVSLFTIYSYNRNVPFVETKKIIQQAIRFILTIVLLYFLYLGREWARKTILVLFTLAILFAIVSLLSINATFLAKTPLFVMIFVYSTALYHFGFSKSYKEYVKTINNKQ